MRLTDTGLASPPPPIVLSDDEARVALAPYLGAFELLGRLRAGGRIVSTNALTPAEIDAARVDGRMWVDCDGFGYVHLHGAPR